MLPLLVVLMILYFGFNSMAPIVGTIVIVVSGLGVLTNLVVLAVIFGTMDIKKVKFTRAKLSTCIKNHLRKNPRAQNSRIIIYSYNLVMCVLRPPSSV